MALRARKRPGAFEKRAGLFESWLIRLTLDLIKVNQSIDFSVV